MKKILAGENKTKFAIFAIVISMILILFFIVLYEKRDIIYTKETYTTKSGDVSTLPYININSEEVNTLNSQLKGFFDASNKEEDTTFNYEYNVNGDIVSLRCQYVYDSSDIIYYQFNINKKTGKIITNEEVLNYYNLTMDDVFSVINNKLEKYRQMRIDEGITNEECDLNCFRSDLDFVEDKNDKNIQIYVKNEEVIEIQRSFMIDGFFDNLREDPFAFELKIKNKNS